MTTVTGLSSFTFETAPEAMEIYEDRYGPTSMFQPSDRNRMVPNWDTPSPDTLRRCEEMLITQDEWFCTTLQLQNCWVTQNRRLWSWRPFIESISCNYCRGSVQVSIRVLLRRQRIFLNPPPGARDIREMIGDGWYTEQIHLVGRCCGNCKREFEVTHTPEHEAHRRYLVPV